MRATLAPDYRLRLDRGSTTHTTTYADGRRVTVMHAMAHSAWCMAKARSFLAEPPASPRDREYRIHVARFWLTTARTVLRRPAPGFLPRLP